MKGRKINWNEKLSQAGFEIRVLDGYTSKYLELSNGLTLNNSEVERFGKRFKSGWNMDLAYHVDEDIRLAYTKSFKSELCRKGGINCQQLHPHVREIASKNLKDARDSGANLAKFKSGEISIWNKGLTKETDPRVMDISKRQQGSNNTSHRQTAETRQSMINKLSSTMKRKILTGEFTPNIKNSLTHWQVDYLGKKFRSSWEAAWFMLNPHTEYEKIRVKYELDGKEKVYIVDFFDPINRLLIEVKPVEHTYSGIFKAKKQAAELWAIGNGLTYVVVTQQYFIDNMDKIMSSDLPPSVKTKIQGIR